MDLTDQDIRAHPELAAFLGVGSSLESLPVVLAAIYADGPTGALQDQARVIIRVGRILSDQLELYVRLLEFEDQQRGPPERS